MDPQPRTMLEANCPSPRRPPRRLQNPASRSLGPQAGCPAFLRIRQQRQASTSLRRQPPRCPLRSRA
eukprot:16451132-Heterocapsa_arctica.AAC.1